MAHSPAAGAESPLRTVSQVKTVFTIIHNPLTDEVRRIEVWHINEQHIYRKRAFHFTRFF